MIAKRSRALTHGQRERLDRVDQAFLHDGSVDRPTYERQRDQVACEFVAAARKLAGQGFTASDAWNRLAEFQALFPLV